MSWLNPRPPPQETPIDHLVKQVDYIAYTLYRTVLPALERIEKRQENLMTAFTDLKASVETYIAAVEVYKTNVAQKIADAVAADEAGLDTDLKTLQSEVDAAGAALTPPAV